MTRDAEGAWSESDVREWEKAREEAWATLVTRNISHFERVPGLRLSHPSELV